MWFGRLAWVSASKRMLPACLRLSTTSFSTSPMPHGPVSLTWRLQGGTCSVGMMSTCVTTYTAPRPPWPPPAAASPACGRSSYGLWRSGWSALRNATVPSDLACAARAAWSCQTSSRTKWFLRPVSCSASEPMFPACCRVAALCFLISAAAFCASAGPASM